MICNHFDDLYDLYHKLMTNFQHHKLFNHQHLLILQLLMCLDIIS